MKKYLFFTIILLTIYFTVVAFNTADFDIWHRLAAGELFFKQGHVQETDIFAYTQTKDLWIDHEWGAGVVFYFIWERFGEAGLGILKFSLIFLTFLPVYLVSRQRSQEPNNYRLIFYLVFLYAVLFGFVYTIRSQCFTFAFFAIWIYLIELVKKGNRKLLWAFPPMTVIWANLHGGFLAGLGLLALAGFPVTAAISGLFTIINPYGFKYWQYLADAVTMQRTFIAEWKPLDLFGDLIIALGFKLFLLMTIITLIYLFVKKAKQIKWTELLILAVTCYLALKHVRHNVFFVIASAAYMSEYFFQAVKYYGSFFPDGFIKGLTFTKKVLSSVIYTIVILCGILTLIFVPLKVDIDETKYPVKSVDFIKKNDLSGNLLVFFNWGGYALWNLYPQCKVSIDGRYEEVYPVSLVNESARFDNLGKDWIDLMKNYKTDLVLIDTSYPVYSELLTMDDWKLVYSDKVSAVFIPSSKDRNNYIFPKDDIVIQNSILKSKISENADRN